MTIHVCVKSESAQRYINDLKKANIISRKYRIHNAGGKVYIPVNEGLELPDSIKKLCVDVEGIPHEVPMKPVPVVGSYDVIGHIAIFKGNDRNKYLDRAREVLETRRMITTVYLDHGVKGDSRTRTLELMAGKDLPEAFYRENGITLRVNVKEAYFSPRLATERLLISKTVRENEKVCDMFAGIGPFSISIAKRVKAEIVAVDSNCRAIELLQENILLNRIIGSIKPICADSGNEVHKHGLFDRIIMNLPHSAFNFIDEAVSSLKTGGVVNYYEISTLEGIMDRMQLFREKGMKLNWKREVHGYSKSENLYSMEFLKVL
ncbi:MAG: class I SAM-dependent methyltransferase family protein [Thermoplasmataceae archaeon]